MAQCKKYFKSPIPHVAIGERVADPCARGITDTRAYLYKFDFYQEEMKLFSLQSPRYWEPARVFTLLSTSGLVLLLMLLLSSYSIVISQCTFDSRKRSNAERKRLTFTFVRAEFETRWHQRHAVFH